MKNTILFCIVMILDSTNLSSQLVHTGLDSVWVSDLRYYDHQLFVATIDSGVYRFDAADSGWLSMGLKNRWINTVYPRKDTDGVFSLLAGVNWFERAQDSISIYNFVGDNFKIADSGIDRSRVDAVSSIDGTGDLVIAGTYWGTYRKETFNWNKVGWFGGRDVKVAQDGKIWMTGMNMFGEGSIIRSDDSGENWMEIANTGSGYPWDYTIIGSIAIEPTNDNTVYVTNGHAVIKTDSACSNAAIWERAFICDHFLSKIAVDPCDGNHLFVGGEHFQLHESTDAGVSWQLITQVDSGNTITDIEIPVTELLTLYISTSKNGIYRLTLPEARYCKAMQMNPGWNFVSLPLIPRDPYKPNVFPAATSKAFSFNGQYEIEDTLLPGKGYWIKYDEPTTEYLIGTEITSLEIDLSLGWNTIGGLSNPLSYEEIVLSPDFTIGPLFKYEGSYQPDTILRPGLGYWVKATPSGKIFLGQ